MIKVGCCGFPKAKKEYYTHFRVVEVQQIFYHPPRVGTCERWRAQGAGCVEIEVSTGFDNEPAQSLYRSQGFEERGLLLERDIP